MVVRTLGVADVAIEPRKCWVLMWRAINRIKRSRRPRSEQEVNEYTRNFPNT